MVASAKLTLLAAAAAALVAAVGCKTATPDAALPPAPAPAKTAATETIPPAAADKNAYLAWRPAGARAKPDPRSAPVGSLKTGDRVAAQGRPVAGADGELWVGVTFGGTAAWVPYRDVIRADIYPALADIERAARDKPDIREMEKAMVRANGGIGNPNQMIISPDGRNYIFRIRYPDGEFGPLLYAAYEKGILDNLGREPWDAALWQKNSRCLVDAAGPGALQTLRLYNAENKRVVVIGKVFAEQFECSGAYILYLTMEKPAAPPAGFPPGMLVPVLMAYEPVEKPYFRVLEPDLNARREGKFGPEVKLVAGAGANKLPETVLDSLLYYTYIGAYAPCWPENAPPGPSPWP